MNILATITPKSDQLNADDLIGRTMTIKVREVSIRAGEDQPVSFFFEGDDNKPFKPCKSMRRVIVNAWGANTADYVGRSMTLFCDPNVTFGKDKVGGIRISHLSDIDADLTMALTVTRANRKPYTVKKMVVPADAAEKYATSFIAKLEGLLDDNELTAFEQEKSAKLDELKAKRPDLFRRIMAAIDERRAEFDESPQSPSPDSPPVEGAETVSGRKEGAETQEGAAPSTLWRTLVEGLATADNSQDVEAFAATFDANEDEIPLDRLGEVQEAIEAARARFTQGDA